MRGKSTQSTRRVPCEGFPELGSNVRLYAGPEAGSRASDVTFGLFLELRDLGFFFLLAQGETQEEHRPERRERQQEFEEAFHLNLPPFFYNQNAAKSQFAF
jgi:hypothetical protein